MICDYLNMEGEDIAQKIDNAPCGSPEDMAKFLFNQPPKDPCSVCLLEYSEKYDNDETSLNFEILLTIYMEGLMSMLDVMTSEAKSKNRNTYDVEYEACKKITAEDLMTVKPWFLSFGYSVQVDEIESDKKSEKKFKNIIKPLSYCRTLFIFDPVDRMHFINKGITKRYTFLMSPSYRPTNKIEEIYGTINFNNKHFTIRFKQFKTQKLEDQCHV